MHFDVTHGHGRKSVVVVLRTRIWAFATVMAIKPLHSYMMSKGCENMVAVYYNRKVAHMVAGAFR